MWRKRWRLAVLFSLLAHLTGTALFWGTAGQDSGASAVLAPLLDTRVRECEIDVLVMDILDAPVAASSGAGVVGKLPVPVLPSVAPPKPAVAAVPPRLTTPATQASGPNGEGSTSGTGGSGGAATTFFDVPAQGKSVVYVIDRSGSMGANGRLDVARRELLASLEKLPATARFQVIAYNRRAEPLRIAGHSDLLPASVENRKQAAVLLNALVPEGGTEHLAALKLALLLQPDVIYFLTDADDLHPEQVRALTQLNRGKSSIHTIELTARNREKNEMPLHVLARDNHGRYRAVE